MKIEEGLKVLAENMSAEAEAIKDYLPISNLPQIKEIISDELAHLLVLTSMLVQEGGFDIADDGVDEALLIIKNHLTKSAK